MSVQYLYEELHILFVWKVVGCFIRMIRLKRSGREMMWLTLLEII